jgi:hypothetical protein
VRKKSISEEEKQIAAKIEHRRHGLMKKVSKFIVPEWGI